MSSTANHKTALFACIAALITTVIYLPALKNGFVNWDDPMYIYENPLIQSFDIDFIKWSFTTFEASNWHPLTWLSYGADYQIWQLNPLGYHLTNIIIHGLNTFFVVILTVNLMKVALSNSLLKSGNKNAGFEIDSHTYNTSFLIAGVLTGLFFGLHPVHVESVAWISERKDVLYSLFFLLSLFFYIKYASLFLRTSLSPPEISNGPRKINYLLSLFFFGLSLLSKPMAVTLPVVLIILDYYPLERIVIKSSITLHFRLLLEKLPFFVLSVALSVSNIIAQGETISANAAYPLWVRLFVAVKALCFYLFKLLVPYNLVPLYPYPTIEAVNIPEYSALVLIVILITFFSIKLWSRNKLFLAVWAYYFITLFPVLGIIQVGDQSAADRYTYLTTLGPMMLAGVGMALLFRKAGDSSLKIQKSSVITAAVLILITLSVLTVKQIGIWKNPITLWNAELKAYPGNYKANQLLGETYYKEGKFESAIEYYSRAIKYRPDISAIFHNRGMAYLMQKNYKMAISDFNESIKLNPTDEQVQTERAFAYRLVINDYSSKIELNPEDIGAYINRGITYAVLKEFDLALSDFNKVITLKPELAMAYSNRGLLYENTGKYESALKDYKTAAGLGDRRMMNRLKSKGIAR